MEKEEFIKNLDKKYYKIVSVSNNVRRIESILKFLNINTILVNCDGGYTDFSLCEFTKTKISITSEKFIESWKQVDGSTEESTYFIIDDILYKNNFFEKIKTIDLTSLTDLTNWINFKTTTEYSIYWSVESKNLKIAIRNLGIFYVTLK